MTVGIKAKMKSIPKKIKFGKISITTVFDNYQADLRLETGWGFSCLVENLGGNILFDTGADPEILLGNMEKIGIDPEKIDSIFISHLHNDHTGGLSGILERNKNIKVYRPGFSSGLEKITKGMWTTGSLGSEIKEQSLIVGSEKGLVVITGCAHPGILSIIGKTKEMFPQKEIYLALGGFHLRKASDAELKDTVDHFRKLGVQKVAPCHCSGDRCRRFFKEEYGADFIENGVGKIIEI